MTIVGAFGNSKNKAHAERAQIQPCCDSDKSDCHKPSDIIAKIHKEQEAEENKKKKRGEIVVNLPHCPSCWL